MHADHLYPTAPAYQVQIGGTVNWKAPCAASPRTAKASPRRHGEMVHHHRWLDGME